MSRKKLAKVFSYGLALFIFSFANPAFSQQTSGANGMRPYKIRIFTDETPFDLPPSADFPNGRKNLTTAQQQMEEVLKTYPFSEYHIIYEIIPHEFAPNACGSSLSDGRLFSCEDKVYDDLQKLNFTADFSKDKKPIVSTSNEEDVTLPASSIWIFKKSDTPGGGAHGKNGAISISHKNPNRMMLHEIMHTFGFSDEYMMYTPEEAEIYCNRKNRGVNLAYIEPLNGNNYESDNMARGAHMHWPDERDAKVLGFPWHPVVESKTLITNGNLLGTKRLRPIVTMQELKQSSYRDRLVTPFDEKLPDGRVIQRSAHDGSTRIGLYPAGLCDLLPDEKSTMSKFKTKFPFYVPDDGVTIMQVMAGRLGMANEIILLSVLDKLAPRREQDPKKFRARLRPNPELSVPPKSPFKGPPPAKAGVNQ